MKVPGKRPGRRHQTEKVIQWACWVDPPATTHGHMDFPWARRAQDWVTRIRCRGHRGQRKLKPFCKLLQRRPLEVGERWGAPHGLQHQCRWERICNEALHPKALWPSCLETYLKFLQRETARARLFREIDVGPGINAAETDFSFAWPGPLYLPSICFSTHLILISIATGGSSPYQRGSGRSVSAGSQGDAGSQGGSSWDSSGKNTSLAARERAWALGQDTDGPGSFCWSSQTPLKIISEWKPLWCIFFWLLKNTDLSGEKMLKMSKKENKCSLLIFLPHIYIIIKRSFKILII